MGSDRLSWGEPSPGRETSGTFVTLFVDDLESLEAARPMRQPAPPPQPDVPPVVAERYRRESLLGRGGMGSVWRMTDTRLRRPVALKVLRAGLMSERSLEQFEEEAQVAAQLQHPGIIPVHDIGQLDDGRLWFTMKEVEGQTLEQLIAEVHRAWRMGREQTESGWGFRRLLEGFLRVCETVAYAHARGVVHRDIKPSNLMFGDYGEVLVLDWGLARVLARDVARPVDVEGARMRAESEGVIAGTPAYMSPEQARGLSLDVGPACDVYALGATLYDLLCERPPRLAKNVLQLVYAVASGKPFEPPSAWAEAVRVDQALDAIVVRALATEPADRYPTAAELAADLASWLDGAQKRERAMELVAQADAEREQGAAEAVRAGESGDEGKRLLTALDHLAPVQDKLEGWALEDQADQARRRVREHQTRAVQLLRSALSHAPDLPEAHARLADLFHARHVELEAEGRVEDAEAVEADLEQHDRARRYAAYLSGDGALTLVTDPPGVEVRLHRYVEQQRRLVPEFERSLGRTPLREARLAMGSYLLTLHREGHQVVRYPVQIRRQDHWDGVPPGGTEPHPIRLPAEGELAADDCYVPAGWFWAGEAEFEHTRPPTRLWAHGLVAKRFAVTVGEQLEFLNALVEDGRADEAERVRPGFGDDNESYFHRDRDGMYTGIRTDLSGGGWDWIARSRNLPATLVDWPSAMAYAAWRAERDGVPWRLPMELEWQHAARGADGRTYPWGERFDPNWCRMRTTAQHAIIVDVDTHPADVSPFGLRGVAGNCSDWALDPYPELPEQRTAQRIAVGSGVSDRRWALGGTCGSGPKTCGLSQRSLFSSGFRALRCGFRLFRDLD